MKVLGAGPTTLGHEFIELSADVTLAILTILDGGWLYAKAQAGVTAAAKEVPITEYLRDGMRRALKEGGHAWAKMLWVLPGTEARSKGTLVPDGRTDIPLGWLEIFLQQGEHDPHAIVECKRIAGSHSNLCREYVVEGIDRFSSGKYGFNHAVGFMVGYLISGTDSDAAAGINSYLVGKSRTTEELKKPGASAWTWASNHNRASPCPPIALHHAFFEFAAAAS